MTNEVLDTLLNTLESCLPEDVHLLVPENYIADVFSGEQDGADFRVEVSTLVTYLVNETGCSNKEARDYLFDELLGRMYSKRSKYLSTLAHKKLESISPLENSYEVVLKSSKLPTNKHFNLHTTFGDEHSSGTLFRLTDGVAIPFIVTSMSDHFILAHTEGLEEINYEHVYISTQDLPNTVIHIDGFNYLVTSKEGALGLQFWWSTLPADIARGWTLPVYGDGPKYVTFKKEQFKFIKE